MHISIILPITLLSISIVAAMLIYLLSTKNLSKDIDEDLQTLEKSILKNIEKKSITKDKLRILNSQMEIIRTNLHKFNNRIYLSKIYKNKKKDYQNKMIEIELFYTKIRLK